MIIFILCCTIMALLICYLILYKKTQKIYFKYERSDFPKMKCWEVIGYKWYGSIGDIQNIIMSILVLVMPLFTILDGLALFSWSSYCSSYQEEKIKVENQYQTCLKLIENNNISNIHYPETIKEINTYNTLIKTKQKYLEKSILKDYEYDFYIEMPIITYEILKDGTIIIK